MRKGSVTRTKEKLIADHQCNQLLTRMGMALCKIIPKVRHLHLKEWK